MEMDILRQILVAIKEFQVGLVRLEDKLDTETSEIKDRMARMENDIKEIKEQQHADCELLEAINVQVLRLTDTGYKFDNRLMKIEAAVV
ncbi:MAG: hypothetical protein FWB96_03175 [Defluviitaleaceae bacterium]|nr:hypothetical protein [Defluviitaleaceae bacterium]MCL2261865.1 hypothetical protein [Defluviitaleaceae bacterium]